MTDPLPDELSEAERARRALIQWYLDESHVRPGNMARWHKVATYRRVPGKAQLSAMGMDALGDGWLPAEPLITPETRVLAIGSCFARSRSIPPPQCLFMNSAYLWLTGEVVACDRMEPPGRPWPTRIFGNVREAPLSEIWNRPEYRAFRQGVLSENLPDECHGCTFCDSVVC